jgi:hypothetical protein
MGCAEEIHDGRLVTITSLLNFNAMLPQVEKTAAKSKKANALLSAKE